MDWLPGVDSEAHGKVSVRITLLHRRAHASAQHTGGRGGKRCGPREACRQQGVQWIVRSKRTKSKGINPIFIPLALCKGYKFWGITKYINNVIITWPTRTHGTYVYIRVAYRTALV